MLMRRFSAEIIYNVYRRLLMAHIPELETIRKTQILNAGMKIISSAGYANVTMADIARAAGFSKGGLAHYFRSKKELFKAVFNEFFSRILERSEENMEKFNDPLEKLLSFQNLYDHRNSESNIGFTILIDCMSMAVHDEEYRIIYHEWVESWVELVKRVIEDGLDKKIFIDVDPDITARAICSFSQGIATRWFLDPESHTTEWAKASFVKAIKGFLVPDNA
jgi:AcrR family transcriptional regulator